MSLDAKTAGDETLLRRLMLAFAGTLPISIALAEPIAFVAFAVWVFYLIRRRDASFLRNPYFWPIAAFSLVALLSSAWGVRPLLTLAKCHRLLLLPIVFIMASVGGARSPRGKQDAALAAALFIGACSIRGVYQVGIVAVAALRGTDLFDAGNMRDPQMYLAALCLLTAGMAQRSWPWRRSRVLAAFAACAAGLILNFKRGAWFAFLASAVAMAVAGRRYRIVLAVVLCAAAVLLLPPVRTRLGMLGDEMSNKIGGRFVLWTEIAPSILRDHPWGMGFKATTHEDLLSYSTRIQPRLNHLHNNLLQVQLELGWPGALVWLWWMVTAFRVTWRGARAPVTNGSEISWLALGVFGAFVGLMLNGVVEYNFGDSEILMLLCFVMGLSCVAGVAGGAGRRAEGTVSASMS